ncbi:MULTISPECIES: tRNA preQ1(34) S-adenosylmethionine ribosyltransferase-isomerase QueA [Anaerotruncus]|uniref:tRNA preQ1(34) S-adenosylmethionine ribosyltransferase-isomerase QueA n=1 Tax=Anaerotruncus TaxID=244127 RepID=UPI0008333AA1|nr:MULTISPECIES: tRNA preQ1(34) S-adenosylmethionine ribosyltransferase-isomerase QueA [Anaerotruncus]RGX56505.1 tRNA preQ1(34) S-adenosylmethionine ribosyltransferase-isomerase QueA [Anaerotruncus sp. AF02-27]
MKKSDFFFDLPPELIAQTPIEPRDHSRMLKLSRKTGEIEHRCFRDVIDYLEPGDTLVVNTSRVIPARLYGHKEQTGAAMQFLLLEQKEKDIWEVLVKPGKKAKTGSRFVFGEGLLTGEILSTVEGGNRLVKMHYEGDSIYPVLEKIGQMPLPPYITETLRDNERYQTVYSNQLGSAAAPTAGLHFTNELLDRIRAKGVNVTDVILHVGLGTFRPVKVDEITDHHMHAEHYHLPKHTADLINETKRKGKRVIAVGTTSCRTLESVASKFGEIREDDDDTSIFIYPGYEFKVLDGLITNFHLPESTLIMLVSAFAGYEHVMEAYKTAVAEQYRFFSFGDAMLIL